MKFKNSLLAVTDMEKSVAFYKVVLGFRKIMDFGANETLTDGPYGCADEVHKRLYEVRK